jgi:sulfatase-modifying factor enzyme 1
MGGTGSRRRRASLLHAGTSRAVFAGATLLALACPAQDAERAFGVVTPSASEAAAEPETLQSQREKLFLRMQAELGLSPEQLERVRRVFASSSILGQGNPRVSLHPIGRAECEAARALQPLRAGDAVCGAPHMAALYRQLPPPVAPAPAPVRSSSSDDTWFAPGSACIAEEPSPEPPPAAAPVVETPRACIDQFEFPNIPCEYPVVHVSAREAAQLCEAVGKRLCDAHEWEGACAGSLRAADEEYAWGNERRAMRQIHNARRTRVWAYGAEKDHARCATTSYKTPGCPGGGYDSCGSNTFPAGAFPGCVSAFGAYDLHGNAAEHMNLPLAEAELTSAGGSGVTEMKGSWFIFSNYEAHEDDCRWRAPDWHPSRVMATHSHGNYHLGFRCCKSVEPVAPTGEL